MLVICRKVRGPILLAHVSLLFAVLSHMLIFCSRLARAVLGRGSPTPLDFPDSEAENDMSEYQANNVRGTPTDDRASSPPAMDIDYEEQAQVPPSDNDDDPFAPGEYNGHPLQSPIQLYTDGPGGAKLSNYSPDVRAIGKLAITLIRGRFSNENPFPDSILLLWWGKATWWEACGMLDIWITYNSELIKLVCGCTIIYSH